MNNLNRFDAAYSVVFLPRFCHRCGSIRQHRRVKYQYSRCLACETCGKEREHKALPMAESDPWPLDAAAYEEEM